jgi:aspartokinase/homoserine dehydrogenase 1
MLQLLVVVVQITQRQLLQVNADSLEIWTDVNGMFTVIPKIIKTSTTNRIYYFLSSNGIVTFWCQSVVSANNSVVLKAAISNLDKNTFEPETRNINFEQSIRCKCQSNKEISHIDTIALLTVEGSGMIGDVAGSSKRLFSTFTRKYQCDFYNTSII